MDIVVEFDDDWIQVPNGEHLPIGERDPTDAINAVYTEAQQVDDECSPVDAVLAAARRELAGIDIQDVGELKALVDPPEEPTSRSTVALVLEEVLSHVAAWETAEPRLAGP